MKTAGREVAPVVLSVRNAEGKQERILREVGTSERHARLDGAWRNVVIVERLLGDARPLPPQGPGRALPCPVDRS